MHQSYIKIVHRKFVNRKYLQCPLFELLNVAVDAVHLVGYLDVLRAMLHALEAPDAMVRLPQFGHGAVVAHEERTACPPVIRVLGVVGYIPLVDTAVVVGEDGGDIDTIRAGHAVVALVAGYGIEVVDVVRNLHQERILVGRDRAQGRIGVQVLAEVLHIGHTAQNGQHAFGGTRETERPRRYRLLGLAALHLGNDIVGHTRQTSAEERLHNHSGNTAFVQFAIEVFGIGVARVDFVGVVPV